jgi:hypothetical protein
VGILQVESLANFLHRLVDGVADLLNIHLADNVERIFLGHGFSLFVQPASIRRLTVRLNVVPPARLYQFPTSGWR